MMTLERLPIYPPEPRGSARAVSPVARRLPRGQDRHPKALSALQHSPICPPEPRGSARADSPVSSRFPRKHDRYPQTVSALRPHVHPVARAVLSAILICLSVEPARAQQPRTAPAVAAPAEQVRIKTADGPELRGTLERFSLADGAVVESAGGERSQLRPEDIVMLETGQTVQPPRAGDITVALTGGDVLYGRLDGTLPDGLRLVTTDLGTLELPLESVASVELAPPGQQPPGGDPPTEIKRDDVVRLRNGDLLRGFVVALDAEQVTLEQGSDTVSVQTELMAGIYLAAGEPPRPAVLHAVATLTQSGRVTLTELNWRDGLIEARCLHGPQVRIARSALVKLDLLGGRWEWLTRHQPISFEHTPMLGLDFDYTPDRNVLGEPLTVAGKTFDHGIGVHSRTRLVYDLRGEYREFVTEFGMDDHSGAYADVDVAIYVDGRQLLARPHVRPGELHVPSRFNVSHGKRLELIVDFGAAGDLQDRFDWINPALVR